MSRQIIHIEMPKIKDREVSQGQEEGFSHKESQSREQARVEWRNFKS